MSVWRAGGRVEITGAAPSGGATGRITFGSPAPAGGVAVRLSSSLPGSVGVPATVTVPAGATSATFTATTSSGVRHQTGQLVATLGDTTLFASLGVTRG